LHVAPNIGDRHFSELFNVRRHSQIIPAIKALPKEFENKKNLLMVENNLKHAYTATNLSNSYSNDMLT
jgi:hypothetical protein